jgi:hypothetical protein
VKFAQFGQSQSVAAKLETGDQRGDQPGELRLTAERGRITGIRNQTPPGAPRYIVASLPNEARSTA